MVPPVVKMRMQMLMCVRMLILTGVVMFYMTLHFVILRIRMRTGLSKKIGVDVVSTTGVVTFSWLLLMPVSQH